MGEFEKSIKWTKIYKALPFGGRKFIRKENPVVPFKAIKEARKEFPKITPVHEFIQEDGSIGTVLEQVPTSHLINNYYVDGREIKKWFDKWLASDSS